MRSRIGSNAFALIASYAPTSLIRALIPAEKATIDKLIRGSVLGASGHRLQYLVDRPCHERRNVSTRKFTSAVCSRRPVPHRALDIDAAVVDPPDIDAVYALLTLCDFGAAWSGTGEDPDRTTPPVELNYADVLRLLLEHRAAPDG